MSDEAVDLFAICDRVFNKLKRISYENLIETEQIFICVWSLEGEVNNGGFEQFYFNSSGDHAVETVFALEKIGANYTADIVREANSVFGPNGPKTDLFDRRAQLDYLSDDLTGNLNALDDKFYEYIDDLESLLKKYVIENNGI